jgi:hypothetical protein
MRTRTKTLTGIATMVATLILAAPAQASTAADDQYGAVLGEQSGAGPGSQGAGSLPFTGADLVVVIGIGTALTASGVAIRRKAAAPER